jgi:hypothetical protein
MEPAVSTAELFLTAVIAGTLGSIVIPANLIEAFSQLGGGIDLELQDSPSAASQQRFS